MQRVKVVLSAAVTYLVAGGVIVGIVSEELASVLPVEWAEIVATWALRVAGWLGAAIGIIRRVTPVIPAEHGILPVAQD